MCPHHTMSSLARPFLAPLAVKTHLQVWDSQLPSRDPTVQNHCSVIGGRDAHGFRNARESIQVSFSWIHILTTSNSGIITSKLGTIVAPPLVGGGHCLALSPKPRWWVALVRSSVARSPSVCALQLVAFFFTTLSGKVIEVMIGGLICLLPMPSVRPQGP